MPSCSIQAAETDSHATVTDSGHTDSWLCNLSENVSRPYVTGFDCAVGETGDDVKNEAVLSSDVNDDTANNSIIKIGYVINDNNLNGSYDDSTHNANGSSMLLIDDVSDNNSDYMQCDLIVQEPDVSIWSEPSNLDASELAPIDPEYVNVDGTNESDSNNGDSLASNEINLRDKYKDNVIISHLNVNSLYVKFQEVSDLIIRSKFEVTVISETKLDNSCQDALFQIENYTMYRQDKRSNSGGLMIYVSKDIPSTKGNIALCHDELEYMSVELNCKETKILLLGMYKNPKMTPNNFKLQFENVCEELTEKYEHLIIIGDLNFNMLHNNALAEICPTFNLTNIITEPTCFKSNNATLIDVMLVTKRRKFLKGFSIDTGISDFHNLIGGVLKQHAPAPIKKTIRYRKLNDIDYEKVNQEIFAKNVDLLMDKINNANEAFVNLHDILITLLDKHAPKKQKVIKRNDFHCMSKRLRKAILKRNQFRNKFFEHRTSHYLAQYRKHRNTVTLIKRDEIKKYFEEKCKGSIKNKDFWKAIKPIFSKSKTKSDNIPLKENNKIITDTDEVCQIFNQFFSKIGSDIGTPENNHRAIHEIVEGYDAHPSISIIKTDINTNENNVEFSEIMENDVRKVIKGLSSKKAAGYDEIPMKFIKMTSHNLVKPMTILANKCIQQNIFPAEMKMANITPIYKKKDKLNKDNYRSVNLLISLSKILEKILSNKINLQMAPFFHRHLAGFRKGHGCHDILTRIVEDWRLALDNGNIVGTVAIDLSKAFDCMPHGLLLAKIHAYGFSLNVCELLKSYLVDRKQRVKIGNTCSEWTSNNKGVPQGSILGPLLFNIFINDLLYHNLHSTVYNYADDNTLSYSSKDINQIIKYLETDCLAAMCWFRSNNMKANAEKFQLMFLSRQNTYSEHSIKLDSYDIKATGSITILGVEFDDKLNFVNHVDELCNQTSKQINALKRMKHYLDKPCKRTIYKSYISCNFNYCPLVWMFAGKTNMDKLEKTNKRGLRFVLNDNEAGYDSLCSEENQLNVYRRCIKAVAIQMYKVKNQLAPIFVQDLFTRRESTYNMRDSDLFNIPRFKTVNYGRKSFRYYGPKLWSVIPLDVKEMGSLKCFKNALTNWLGNSQNLSAEEFL